MAKTKETERTCQDLAWAFCVVSSGGQGATLPDQRAWAKEEARRRGWRLPDAQIFSDVGSGKDGVRKIVRSVLHDLKATPVENRPRWLLTISCDRIGRGDSVETMLLVRDLRDLGVTLLTRDQGEIKNDSAMEQLMLACLASTAAVENERRRDKSINKYISKRNNGEHIGNRLPYGLKREPRFPSDLNGTIVPDGKCADAVREAFKLRLQGLGYQSIGRRLATFAPPHKFKAGKNHPVEWIPNRVSQLLKTRSYVPHIIDEATFIRAQRVSEASSSKDRSGNRAYPWPLSGTMRCFCGKMLIGTVCGGTKTRPSYRYYGCRFEAHNGRIFLVPAEILEQQFLDLLARLKASPTLVERWRKRAVASASLPALEKSIKELSGKVADIAKRRRRVFELFEIGTIDKAAIKKRLNDLQQQDDEVQGQLVTAKEGLAVARASASRKREVADLFHRAPEIFRKANIEQKKQIAKACMVELGGFTVGADKTLRVGAL